MLHDGSNSNDALMFEDEMLEHFIENQTQVFIANLFLIIMSDLIYKIFGFGKRKNAEIMICTDK